MIKNFKKIFKNDLQQKNFGKNRKEWLIAKNFGLTRPKGQQNIERVFAWFTIVHLWTISCDSLMIGKGTF